MDGLSVNILYIPPHTKPQKTVLACKVVKVGSFLTDSHSTLSMLRILDSVLQHQHQNINKYNIDHCLSIQYYNRDFCLN